METAKRLLGVLLIGFCCYGWALDNGFMSDDLVQLDQTSRLAHFETQLDSAPSAFRLTAFAWFGLLQWLVGYQPVIFYVMSIVLHCLIALLFRRVLILRGTDAGLANLSALLFMVMQNPNEAIGWLSAVNELLVGFFVIAALWAAYSRRYAACLALYAGALLSKESGAVVMLLLPLFALVPGPDDRSLKLPRWLWLGLAGLTFAFLARFVSLVETNFLIQSRFYSVGSSSVLVLAFSLHKLAFPWLYLAGIGAVVLGWKARQPSGTGADEFPERKVARRELGIALIWMVFALLPYIFLIYDTHVPSRQMYLAAMPAAYLLARLVSRLPMPWLRRGFVALFLMVNAGYMWLAKDAQYRTRAETTRGLISILESREPGCLIVRNFPENPWIAKLSARFVPGWSPDMIKVDEIADQPGCAEVAWDGARKRYKVLRQ